MKRTVKACVTAVLVAGAAVVALANPDATYVLKSGERVTGALTYKGGAEFTLIINGQERDFSPDDVALMSFVSGDPSVSELQKLPSSDNPPELDRHMLVTRGGQIIHAKLYHISRDGETITYDTLEGSQPVRGKTIPTSQVARLYISASGARSVYASKLRGLSNTASGEGGGTGVIEVPANQQWTDTGITVRRGERVAFFPEGQVKLSEDPNPDFVAGPAGNPALSLPRNGLPVQVAPWGTLIARVGAGTPFPVGTRGGTAISMPAAGRLYLGINETQFGDNSGAFTVRLVR